MVFVLCSPGRPLQEPNFLCLSLLYLQALCHPPCGPWWPYDVRPALLKEHVFSPHEEEVRPHPGGATQRALPLKEPTVSVMHDTRCSLNAGWAC